jgi:hypothetical protein
LLKREHIRTNALARVFRIEDLGSKDDRKTEFLGWGED